MVQSCKLKCSGIVLGGRMISRVHNLILSAVNWLENRRICSISQISFHRLSLLLMFWQCCSFNCSVAFVLSCQYVIYSAAYMTVQLSWKGGGYLRAFVDSFQHSSPEQNKSLKNCRLLAT